MVWRRVPTDLGQYRHQPQLHHGVGWARFVVYSFQRIG